uniref:Dynein regulatory complex subunit 2 n=1 Tax=Gopherus evgoodei TaxID=1825980 RepID=A0A8C4WB16_9SAUR
MPKKGRKAAALSEERLLLMQQKMLAEEELSKKKEDMLTQFLKDKLAKEEHNSALNLNKINLQWRTVLREVKARELRKDIEILSQTFERVVDCKDSVIQVSSRGPMGPGRGLEEWLAMPPKERKCSRRANVLKPGFHAPCSPRCC